MTNSINPVEETLCDEADAAVVGPYAAIPTIKPAELKRMIVESQAQRAARLAEMRTQQGVEVPNPDTFRNFNTPNSLADAVRPDRRCSRCHTPVGERGAARVRQTAHGHWIVTCVSCARSGQRPKVERTQRPATKRAMDMLPKPVHTKYYGPIERTNFNPLDQEPPHLAYLGEAGAANLDEDIEYWKRTERETYITMIKNGEWPSDAEEVAYRLQINRHRLIAEAQYRTYTARGIGDAEWLDLNDRSLADESPFVPEAMPEPGPGRAHYAQLQIRAHDAAGFEYRKYRDYDDI